MFKCEFCPQTFHGEDGLIRHEDLYHSKEIINLEASAGTKTRVSHLTPAELEAVAHVEDPVALVAREDLVTFVPKNDNVNHPKHYTSHPSGIECIQITRHMGFNLGNAFKYIWRADLKHGTEDLKKAIWYLQDELEKREGKVKTHA